MDPRFAYAPLSADFSQPSDRRRFVHWAKRRGIPFEIADPEKEADVVILSQGADLSRWVRKSRGREKIVFDFIDSYLAPAWDARSLLRGAGKFAFRQNRHLHLNYRSLLEAMCRRSDAVICSTDEQRRNIEQFCPNVHVVLDVHTGAVRETKTDYSSGDTFNVVWEGLPGNLTTFRTILPVLKRLRERRKIAIHLITDLERALALRNVGRVQTKHLVRRVFGMDDVFLYEWNELMFAEIATACDLAVIPIPLDRPIYAGKPENKLLLLWRMGLPVITSATPAYARAMKQAGLSMSCRSMEEWERMLDRYMDDEDARREAGRRGRAFAEAFHGEERLLERWDAVFASVLEGEPQSAQRAQRV